MQRFPCVDVNQSKKTQILYSQVHLEAISGIMRSASAVHRVIGKYSDPQEADKEITCMLAEMQKVRTDVYMEHHPDVAEVTYEAVMAFHWPKILACPLTRAIFNWEVEMTARLGNHSAAQYAARAVKDATARCLCHIPGIGNATLYVKLWAETMLQWQMESPVYKLHHNEYVQHVETAEGSGHAMVLDLYQEKIVKAARRKDGRTETESTAAKLQIVANRGYFGRVLPRSQPPRVPPVPKPGLGSYKPSRRRRRVDRKLSSAMHKYIAGSGVWGPVGEPLKVGKDNTVQHEDAEYVTMLGRELSAEFLDRRVDIGRQIYRLQLHEELGKLRAKTLAEETMVPRTKTQQMQSTTARANDERRLEWDADFSTCWETLFNGHMDGPAYSTQRPSSFAGGGKKAFGMTEGKTKIKHVRTDLQARRHGVQDGTDSAVKIDGALDAIGTNAQVDAVKQHDSAAAKDFNGRSKLCKMLANARKVEQSFWPTKPTRPSTMTAGSNYDRQSQALDDDMLPDIIRCFSPTVRAARATSLGLTPEHTVMRRRQATVAAATADTVTGEGDGQSDWAPGGF